MILIQNQQLWSIINGRECNMVGQEKLIERINLSFPKNFNVGG